MVIAFDIDDTITRHPKFFSVISSALVDAGHVVLIITNRHPDDRRATEMELQQYGIRFAELVMCELGASFFSWKAKICKERGVEVFFEDMQEVIREVGEETLCLMAVDREIHDLDALCK